MAKINTLTYNGTKSSDLGVFVSGSGSFDAAEFDVDKYEIPGRNGDLILSNNRYKNIEITYPAFIPKAFMDKVQNVRNWLRSSRVYARLEDTYDMDHYRLGISTGVQSFAPENRNDGANFEMTFDCKPQRFLKVGETPETLEADVQTETGEIVTFETVAESPITSASVSLSPIQSLNGYDSPWPGGGGKNKFAPLVVTETAYGVTITVPESGVITVRGTNDGGGVSNVLCGEAAVTAGTQYRLSTSASGGTTATYWTRFVIRNANGNALIAPEVGSVFIEIAPSTDNFLITVPTDGVKINAYIVVASGQTVDATFKPMVRLASVTDASFSPYSNICPISGHTGAELWDTAKNMVFETLDGVNISGSGVLVAEPSYNMAVAYVKRGQQYTITTNETTFIGGFFTEKPSLGSTTYNNQRDITVKTITAPIDGYVCFRIANHYSTPQIEQGATATDFSPFTTEYSVTFTDQGTVYGGTYDFVSGKLVVTHAGKLGSEFTWQYNATYKIGYTYMTGKKPGRTNIISSAYKTVDKPYSTMLNGEISGALDTGVNVKDDSTSTLEEFQTAVANVQFVYELATPIEYTLSLQQLTTLQGQNVVWGNGTVTMTYAEPYNIENPTLFDARPLFTVTNPAEGDVIMVNSQAITFVDGYTGTVFIDCETMNAFSGAANLNSIIQATDFPVLVPGTNIVTWTGAGECTMTPRWWEL